MLPAFEHTCGCHFASEWAAASAGKVVISIPNGRAVTQGDLVELNACFGAALQLLADFYGAAGKTDATEAQAALTIHLQQVAWHRANVETFTNPELEF